MNEQVSKFWLICEDNVCHCDWRYSIVGCDEEYYARIFYIVTAVTSGLLAIIGTRKMSIKVQLFFFFQKKITVNTINSKHTKRILTYFYFFFLMFYYERMIHAVFMVTDAIPNPVFRSFFFEFPFLFGYCAIASYLFGVAYTLSDTSYGIFKSWVRSQKMVNTLCVLTIISPFITNISLPIASGYYASIDNISYANTLTTVQYYIWTFYTLYLGTLLLSAGIKLLQLLDKHLLVQTDLRKNITKFKTGALKVKIIVLVGTSVLWIFAFLLAMYSICRPAILKTTGLNMVVLAIWQFAGVIATFFVEIAILIK
ncbi:hypothetical protein K501DRAFT_183885 [Backusella circina FSU 941]|nr:hypothetical protein K501DRAFT_183885 [Backusella circina FSU 941]